MSFAVVPGLSTCAQPRLDRPMAHRPCAIAHPCRKRPPQLGTLKLGSTRDATARPYAYDFDSLPPKGTQGPVLWTLLEPDMRLLVVSILRAVLWHPVLSQHTTRKFALGVAFLSTKAG